MMLGVFIMVFLLALVLGLIMNSSRKKRLELEKLRAMNTIRNEIERRKT